MLRNYDSFYSSTRTHEILSLQRNCHLSQ